MTTTTVGCSRRRRNWFAPSPTYCGITSITSEPWDAIHFRRTAWRPTTAGLGWPFRSRGCLPSGGAAQVSPTSTACRTQPFAHDEDRLGRSIEFGREYD